MKDTSVYTISGRIVTKKKFLKELSEEFRSCSVDEEGKIERRLDRDGFSSMKSFFERHKDEPYWFYRSGKNYCSWNRATLDLGRGK